MALNIVHLYLVCNSFDEVSINLNSNSTEKWSVQYK